MTLVERVARAGSQLAARVPLPDIDNASAIMEWRAAIAALRASEAPPARPHLCSAGGCSECGWTAP